MPGEKVCDSPALRDAGPGVRFHVEVHGRMESAFVIRHDGRVHGYLNRCAHKFVELDWEPGQFFDADGRYLICATHGALYEPANGHCVAGPCRGAVLVPLPVAEHGGAVWLAGSVGTMLK